MALKRKITKEAFDKLKDDIKAEYKQVGDDYVLDTEGDEDTSALKRALERERLEKKEAAEKLADLELKMKDEETITHRKKGDIDALEKSWNAKVENEKKVAGETIGKRNSIINRLMIDNEALKLAQKISTAPNVMLPHIQKRMMLEWNGDEPVTRILDATGKPSAMSVEDLSKELIANKDFSAIIVGSKASGGAGGAANGGGAPNQPLFPAKSGESAPNLAKMNPAELAASIKANKAATTES